MTIACIDVGYTENDSVSTTAIAACVVINDWRDPNPAGEYVVEIKDVQDYEPGQFYRR